MSKTIIRLTPNFQLSEFVESPTAAMAGVDNTPPEEVVGRLKQLAESLEVVKTALGGASVTVKSGYRCEELNAIVGGSSTSAHKRGWAADIKAAGFTPRQVAEHAVQSGILFDQIILEGVSKDSPDGAWVHISIDPISRREVKTMTRVDGKKRYTKGLI